MRVLVTGATGFVGYAVAGALLDAGHEVVALTRSDRPLPAGVQRAPGDLIDGGSVAEVVRMIGPDAVCHLAALVRVRDSRVDPIGYWRTNVGGTLALLEALSARTTSTLLVAASTCAVYGERAAQPIADDEIPCPTSPYATSKLAADHAIADVAATGAVGAVSIRAFNVAGGLPGHPDRDESRLIPKLVAVAQGRAPELIVNGDGSTVRDFLHVADMADAFVRALAACRPGHWVGYNVGSGLQSTIADVIAQPSRSSARHCRSGATHRLMSRASYSPTRAGSPPSSAGDRGALNSSRSLNLHGVPHATHILELNSRSWNTARPTA